MLHRIGVETHCNGTGKRGARRPSHVLYFHLLPTTGSKNANDIKEKHEKAHNQTSFACSLLLNSPLMEFNNVLSSPGKIDQQVSIWKKSSGGKRDTELKCKWCGHSLLTGIGLENSKNFIETFAVKLTGDR